MQLSPLQSRLVASLAATVCLLALYLLLLSPNGALAAELPLDATSPWLDLAILDTNNGETQTSSYEPIFSYFSRSILGRAGDITPLENNKPLALGLNPGSSPICYIIKKGSLATSGSKSSQRRQDDSGSAGNSGNNNTIYISANTCLQPTTKPGKKATTPPQMMLFVSNNTNAGCPEITSTQNGATAKGFTSKIFNEGAVTYNINATNDVYVAIYAPTISEDVEGAYNFEIAASNTGYFHQYEVGDGAELLWMDSDSTSALLDTRSLTDDVSQTRHVMSEDPPYQLYVSGQDAQYLNGIRHSACGLQKNALIGANNQGNAKNNSMIKTAMTLRGTSGLPKQQFYVVGLNSTTNYTGVLVKPANVTVNSKRQAGGDETLTNLGSIVFQATNFSTNAGKLTTQFLVLILFVLWPWPARLKKKNRC